MFENLSFSASLASWVSQGVTDGLGACAALLTTGSFLPQAILTLRTQDVSGISAGMYSMFTLGVALWLVYGILLGEWPIILANLLTLALASMILFTKLRVERRRRTVMQQPD
jgi:MtN3 and saliva related transmembrane protein